MFLFMVPAEQPMLMQCWHKTRVELDLLNICPMLALSFRLLRTDPEKMGVWAQLKAQTVV